MPPECSTPTLPTKRPFSIRWVAWAIFLGAFVLIFVAVLAVFEMLFRITGLRYTNLLGEKQNQK